MYNKNNKNKMTKEQLRMQMLAGVITESEYKAKLEENLTINADYHESGGSSEEKFARVLSDNVMAGYDEGTISDLYREEMREFKNGDPEGFYIGEKESLEVFRSLPDRFKVVAKLVDEEPFIFRVYKTGEDSYMAEEI